MTRARTHNHHFEIGRCRTCHSWCRTCRKCHCATDAEYGERVRAEMAAGQQVLDGQAFGGPRDGVRLTASARWNGEITTDPAGHYVWVGAGWKWKAYRLPAAPARRVGRPRKS